MPPFSSSCLMDRIDSVASNDMSRSNADDNSFGEAASGGLDDRVAPMQRMSQRSFCDTSQGFGERLNGELFCEPVEAGLLVTDP